MLIHSYHLITHIPLDYGLIIDNFTIGFYRESWYTIIGVFPRALFIGLGIFLVILIIIHIKKRILWSPPGYRRPAVKTAVAAVVYVLALALPLRTYDEFTGLLRGMVRYPFQDPMSHIEVKGYPYLKTFTAAPVPGRGAARPTSRWREARIGTSLPRLWSYLYRRSRRGRGGASGEDRGSFCPALG